MIIGSLVSLAHRGDIVMRHLCEIARIRVCGSIIGFWGIVGILAIAVWGYKWMVCSSQCGRVDMLLARRVESTTCATFGSMSRKWNKEARKHLFHRASCRDLAWSPFSAACAANRRILRWYRTWHNAGMDGRRRTFYRPFGSLCRHSWPDGALAWQEELEIVERKCTCIGAWDRKELGLAQGQTWRTEGTLALRMRYDIYVLFYSVVRANTPQH